MNNKLLLCYVVFNIGVTLADTQCRCNHGRHWSW